MGVPRAHTTKGDQGRRRSHLALKPMIFSFCSHCGQRKLPHKVCTNCGFYKGKEVINVLARELKKKEKKKHGK